MTDVQKRLASPKWDPKVSIAHDTVQIDDLSIEFMRTIRVPDNQQVSALPPSLGPFPLKYVKDFTSTISETMKAKGGIFFPMYRKS
jgi:hypothetical protein